MDKVEAYKKLTMLKESGINVVSMIKLMASSDGVPEAVLEFINKNTMTEADKFFENLRKMHSKKNHQLYPSILSEDMNEVGKLKCLSSYMTSACIAMESMDDPNKIIELRKSLGLEVVSEALYCYYNGKDYDKINEALIHIRGLIKRN